MKATNVLLSIVFLLVLLVAFNLYSQTPAQNWFNKGRKADTQEEKVKCYKKAIELMPTFISAHYNLGRTYRETGQFEKALESYQNALTCDPEKLDDNFKQMIEHEVGVVYDKLGRYQEAEDAFTKALNLSNEASIKAMMLYKLGQVNLSMAKYDKAIAHFQQAIDIYPTNQSSLESFITLAKNQKKLSSLYNDSETLMSQNKYEAAIANLQEIINIDPSYKDSKELLAKAQQLFDSNRAESDLKDNYNKGLVAIKNNDWQGAIEAFDDVVVKSPDYEKAKEYLTLARQKIDSQQKNDTLEKSYNEGLAAVNKNDYMSAIIAFERVREIDPNYKNITTRIQQIQKMLETQDSDATKIQYYNQGLEAYKNGDWERALNTFNKLYVLDHNFQDVQYLLAQTKEKVNKTSIPPDKIDIYYQKGKELMEQKNYVNALINFEKVNAVDPNYKEVYTLIREARQFVESSRAENFAVAPVSDNKKNNPILTLTIGFIIGIFIPFLAVMLLFPTARAKLYLFQKKYDKARNIYERMLDQNPERINLYITLANIYMNEKRKDEIAVRVFEKAIEANASSHFKKQIRPILSQYYLDRQKISNSSLNLLEASLEDELKNLGN
jgi:tetratricopeptide (TPR) repeat protein